MKDADDDSWVFTLPLDVIWKHQMGERYCTWPRLVALTYVMCFAIMMMALFFLSSPTLLSPKTPKFIGAVLGLIGFYGLPLLMWIFGAKNIAEIGQRKKAGVQVHSYYMGTPRFLSDKEIVHRLVIPAGSILAGAVFFPFLAPFGAYIAFMGLCQFLTCSDIRTQNQTRKMDEEDRKMAREGPSSNQ